MPAELQITVDKFTFKIATDRQYTGEGVWARDEGDCVRIGLSDFLQQRSGDVAFVSVKPPGTIIATGDEVAVIETIKATLDILSPVAGKVIEVNPAMESSPETINTDPNGAGWLAMIQASEWKADRARLHDPEAYLTLMKSQAEEESSKR